MKRLLGVFFFILITTSIFGQQIITSLKSDKVWFIGGSAGIAMPVSKYKHDARSGLNFAINYGYMFSDYFGVEAKGFKMNNSITNNINPSFNSSLGDMTGIGAVVGPFIAFRPTRTTEIGVHTMFGVTNVTMPDGAFNNNKRSSFTTNLGGTFRLNLNKLVLFCDVDYLLADPTFDEIPYKITNLTTTLGVAIRFKRVLF